MNMSYCRFSNTYQDLKDCYEHMDKTGSSQLEEAYRLKLIRLCEMIAHDYADELEKKTQGQAQ